MSVLVASFRLISRSGSYAYTISSCNPDQPVSFQIGDEPYDASRLTQTGTIGGKSGSDLSIATFPQSPVPTTWNENPIKLVIYPVGQGFGVPLAVFYGYYTRPDAGGLGFYQNVGQGQCDPYTGSSPARPFIDNSVPSISLG